METVEVVVRIPKKVLEDIQCVANGSWGRKNLDYLELAILDGTVLPKGQWIQQPRCEGDEQPDLVCPNCGFKISWWDMGNFCAKCGKELEGGAE